MSYTGWLSADPTLRVSGSIASVVSIIRSQEEKTTPQDILVVPDLLLNRRSRNLNS
jgi:hypothetical protein